MTFRPDIKDYEQDWQNFWEPIMSVAHQQAVDEDDYYMQETALISRAELEQIKKELSDYHDLMTEAGSVYYEITEGRVSKPNTTADAVLSVYEDMRQEYQQHQEKALELILDLCYDADGPESLNLVDTISRIVDIADNAIIGADFE